MFGYSDFAEDNIEVLINPLEVPAEMPSTPGQFLEAPHVKLKNLLPK
jgi:hypothetical protein